MERELWTSLYEVACRLDQGRRSWRYRSSEIAATYLWGVAHDRPMSWSVRAENWPADLRPWRLPSQSTLSRRMRSAAVEQLMTAIECAWLTLVFATRLLWCMVIDAKPLAVSGVSKDRDAGYGRGAGGMLKGYKFYAVWGGGPLPLAWALAPMNHSEKTLAKELIPTLPGAGGYLLGDGEYDANGLYALTRAAGHQLLAPKRGKANGWGHRPHDPDRRRASALLKTRYGKALMGMRKQIERDFGNWCAFGGGLNGLPAWVRRFNRVRNWIQAKLLINAARWFKNHPITIANA